MKRGRYNELVIWLLPDSIMKIAITHGTGGNPSINWFPWLSQELRALGHSVIVPAYPTPERQSLNNWFSTFDEEFGFPNLTKETVLIGHSIGAAFTLRLLQEANEPIKACFLVAGFTHELGLPEYDVLNQTFIREVFDWPYLRSRAGKVFVYHSENDPYVPLKFGEEISNALGTKLTLIPGGGHLNSETGFTKFPRILDDLKTVLT